MEHKDENIYNKQVFADNLRFYINKKGVTQRDVAEILGVSPGTISDWLRLRTYPRMDKIQMLAEYFGIEKSNLVEDRNLEEMYGLQTEVRELEQKMIHSSEALEFHLAIERLSASNKAIVKALVDSLLKGEN